MSQLKTTAIDILMNISDLRASYRLATVLWYWRDRYLSSAAQKNGGSNQILPTMDGKAGEARLPLGTAADEDNGLPELPEVLNNAEFNKLIETAFLQGCCFLNFL